MTANTARRRSGFTLAGAVILGTLAVVALAAPLLAPYDPHERVGTPFSAPSSAHLLGTNDVGHDLLSELVFGARISLLVGMVAALAATGIGVTVGLLAGYARGWVDAVLMRLVDVLLSLPLVPLAIVIGVFAGSGLTTQIAVIAAVTWAPVARELRAQTLSLRERDHIQALRAMGARTSYLLPRHLLPAIAVLVVPQFVLATKSAVLLEATLAFLGLGDVTAKSWGTMLSLAHARSAFLTDAWLWWVIPPGAAIALTILGFALLGSALEERGRPSLRDRLRRPRPRTMDHSAQTGAAADHAQPGAALVVDGLTVGYDSVGYGSWHDDAAKRTLALDQVNLTVAAGEIVGLVGESGSGKSTLAAAALGMLPPGASIEGGQVVVDGHDVAAMSAAELRTLRGNRIALIPQEAMSALNPVLTIGAQLAEAVTAHRRLGREAVDARIAELLTLVRLDPARSRDYPHQLSGGMRQRVVIAMALAAEPAVVVADEPTSGLDVGMQVKILDLLDELHRRLHPAMVIISHDLPVIESIADRIAVLRDGRLIEVGSTEQVVTAPTHPYTRRLVESAPRLQLPQESTA